MQDLYEQARRYIPGGVNSPVRAFRAVGGQPVFLRRGAGSRVWDAEGREYIDYLGSWGPMILGHCHPRVVAAIKEAAETGTSFGMPTEWETELARIVVEAFPAIEKVRFVSSGTEATMSALRLARGATGRDLIVKMAGCYHGHADALLVKAGSGLATLGIPGSPGVPEAVAARTLTAPFNDLGALEEIFREHGDRIACVILEPVAGNMGVVPPRPGWLEGVRELTSRHGALFICDEVMTGFRVAWGGAQQLYGVRPDLVTLGKILGGGLPAAAYGGPARIMDQLAPDGPVYQAGTLSGNPLAMRAGAETLRLLRPEGGRGRDGQGPYARLETLSRTLHEGILDAGAKAGAELTVNRVGSMMTVFFTAGAVENWEDASRCDTGRYAAFFRGMLAEGVFLPPSQFEAFFVSLAHSEQDVDRTITACGRALGRLGG